MKWMSGAIAALMAMAVGLAPNAVAADLDLTPDIVAPSPSIRTDGDMALDTSGRLYVASKLNTSGRVRVYDDPTNLNSVSTEILNLDGPDGIAVSSDGSRIFIAEDNGGRVSVYYRNGSGFSAGTPITGLPSPKGVWLTPDNLLYVTLFNDTVRQYLVTGSGPSTTLTLQKTFSGIETPYGVTVDSAGTLYVSEVFRARIRAFSASTVAACGATCAITPDRTITGSSTLLNGPWFMETDSDGRLFVSNYYDASVLVFSPTASGDEAPLLRVKGPNTLLQNNTGLAVDSSGNFFTQNAPGAPQYWFRFPAQFASGSSAATGRTEQTPPDILQEVPMPETGACVDVVDDHVSYGSGLTGGWSKAWGEWANDRAGGWVCGRTLTYVDRLGKWTIAG